MQTIFKNELPPGFKKWEDLCTQSYFIGEMYVLHTKKEDIPVQYYIQTDFAKARAWEESKKKEARKKKESSPLYKMMVDFWLKEFKPPGWSFNATSGKALKSILLKIYNYNNNAGFPNDDDRVLESFKLICRNLPVWYQTKDLPIIDSKLNEIIAEIKFKQNGTFSQESADRKINSIYS